MIKLNVGASPIWYSEGWHTLDHNTRENTKITIEVVIVKPIQNNFVNGTP